MSKANIELSSKKQLLKLLEKPENYNVTVTFHMKQEDLIKLATSEIGSKVKELVFNPEYRDGSPVLDFSQVQFPVLERLEIQCQAIEAINFTKENYPELRSLTIENITAKDPAYFKTDLPKLEFMKF